MADHKYPENHAEEMAKLRTKFGPQLAANIDLIARMVSLVIMQETMDEMGTGKSIRYELLMRYDYERWFKEHYPNHDLGEMLDASVHMALVWKNAHYELARVKQQLDKLERLAEVFNNLTKNAGVSVPGTETKSSIVAIEDPALKALLDKFMKPKEG